MTMPGAAAAQARYDAQEPPDEVECRFCDGSEKVAVLKVEGCYGDAVDWPYELDDQLVPCPCCLAGTPLAREVNDD